MMLLSASFRAPVPKDEDALNTLVVLRESLAGVDKNIFVQF